MKRSMSAWRMECWCFTPRPLWHLLSRRPADLEALLEAYEDVFAPAFGGAALAAPPSHSLRSISTIASSA